MLLTERFRSEHSAGSPNNRSRGVWIGRLSPSSGHPRPSGVETQKRSFPYEESHGVGWFLVPCRGRGCSGHPDFLQVQHPLVTAGIGLQSYRNETVRSDWTLQTTQSSPTETKRSYDRNPRLSHSCCMHFCLPHFGWVEEMPPALGFWRSRPRPLLALATPRTLHRRHPFSLWIEAKDTRCGAWSPMTSTPHWSSVGEPVHPQGRKEGSLNHKRNMEHLVMVSTKTKQHVVSAQWVSAHPRVENEHL